MEIGIGGRVKVEKNVAFGPATQKSADFCGHGNLDIEVSSP